MKSRERGSESAAMPCGGELGRCWIEAIVVVVVNCVLDVLGRKEGICWEENERYVWLND